MSKEVPLVVYRNTGDGEKRCVIGTATLIEGGTFVAQITDQLFIEELSQDIEVSSDSFRLYKD